MEFSYSKLLSLLLLILDSEILFRFIDYIKLLDYSYFVCNVLRCCSLRNYVLSLSNISFILIWDKIPEVDIAVKYITFKTVAQ